MAPVIQTARLDLRPLDDSDVGNLQRIFSDPVAMKHYPSLYDIEATKRWIAKSRMIWDTRKGGMFACQLRAGGEFVGQCGLWLQNIDGEEFLEIGYLFVAAHWGKGYAAEAAAAVRDYGFSRLEQRRLISMIRPQNAPSIRVAQRTGLMAWKLIKHAGMDHIVFKISRGNAPAASRLQTSRLFMRELVAEDLDWTAALMADAEVMRYIGKTLNREESAQWIERCRASYAKNGFGMWAVIEKENGKPVGQCGVQYREIEGVLEPEVGYMFAREHWGKGYAVEAAQAALDFGLSKAGKTHLIAIVQPENIASVRVAQRIGMLVRRLFNYKGSECLEFRIARPGGIRSAVSSDFEAICDLAPYARRNEFRANNMRRAIADRLCFVIDGEIQTAGPDALPPVVAFATMSYSFYDNAFIDLLVVHEAHRRKGHGRALIEHIIRQCKTPKLFTSTNRSNTIMQALLEKLEFARCGEVDQLDEGDPEWMYVRISGR